MITGNCDFTRLIYNIKAIVADLDVREQGAPGIIFVARLLALADMTSDAAKMVREDPALNGIYWEITKFYADQKKEGKRLFEE